MMTNRFKFFPTINLLSLGLTTFRAWTSDQQRKSMESMPEAKASKATKTKYSYKMIATPALLSKQLGYLQSKHTASWEDAALNALRRGNYSNQVSWSKRPGLLLVVHCGTQKGSPQPTQTSQQQQKKPKTPTPKPFDITSTVANFQRKCAIKSLAKAVRSMNYLWTSLLTRKGNSRKSGFLLPHAGFPWLKRNVLRHFFQLKSSRASLYCPQVKIYWCRTVQEPQNPSSVSKWSSFIHMMNAGTCVMFS